MRKEETPVIHKSPLPKGKKVLYLCEECSLILVVQCPKCKNHDAEKLKLVDICPPHIAG